MSIMSIDAANCKERLVTCVETFIDWVFVFSSPTGLAQEGKQALYTLFVTRVNG